MGQLDLGLIPDVSREGLSVCRVECRVGFVELVCVEYFIMREYVFRWIDGALGDSEVLLKPLMKLP